MLPSVSSLPKKAKRKLYVKQLTWKIDLCSLWCNLPKPAGARYTAIHYHILKSVQNVNGLLWTIINKQFASHLFCVGVWIHLHLLMKARQHWNVLQCFATGCRVPFSISVVDFIHEREQQRAGRGSDGIRVETFTLFQCERHWRGQRMK